MEVLRALIVQMFENGDKLLECLLITSSTVGQDIFDGPRLTTLPSPSKSSLLHSKPLSTSSSIELSSNLYWYLMGQFLPMTAIVMTVDRMLGQSRANTAAAFYNHATCRLVSFLLRVLRDRGDRSKEDDNTMAQQAMTVLAAWMGFDMSQLNDKCFVDFVQELECSLCWTLSRAYSSLALLTYDYAAVIRRFIEIKVATFNWSTYSQICLLTVLVSSDPMKFGEAFFQVHVAMLSDKEYRKIFNCGTLDAALVAILKYDNTRKVYEAGILSVIELVNKRLSMLCLDFNITANQMNDLLRLTQKLMDVRSESVSEKLNTNLLADLLTRLLTQNNQQTGITPNLLLDSTYHQYVDVALYICVQCSTESSAIKSLASVLFMNLCDTIAQTVNLSYRRSKDSHASDVCIHASLQTIAWMRELISNEVTFDMNIWNHNGVDKLRSVLKFCLRQGMRIETNELSEVQSSYLQLVSMLIAFAYSGKNPLGRVDDIVCIPANQSVPSQIFNMVTSHSKFDVLMRSSESSNIQIELSCILFTCISCAADIEFCMDTWASLLACYDCGVDDKDIFLRSILFEYSRIASQVRQLSR